MKESMDFGPISSNYAASSRKAQVLPQDQSIALKRLATAGMIEGSESRLQEGLIRPRELAATLGISRSTLFAWTAAGRVPPGIKLSRSVRVWPRADLPDIVAALAQE
ncbi:helix-turn-helix transcriptional regulator [Ancylobacter sp.]|uniref:helix-turn-helix transcriptional regulator n=1 Tax=Ancylobacter sp. TaxID=1872567 RepID=UPI003BAD9B87